MTKEHGLIYLGVGVLGKRVTMAEKQALALCVCVRVCVMGLQGGKSGRTDRGQVLDVRASVCMRARFFFV